MDPKIYEALRQAVAEGLTRNTLLVLALTAIISIACAYVTAYWRRRAENLATKDDFKSLKAQLDPEVLYG
jgi:ABC-type Fe3+ transport system permease subunit